MATEPVANTSLRWSRCDAIGESGWNHDRVWSRALGSIIEMAATTAGVSSSTQADTSTASSAIAWPREQTGSSAADVALQAAPFSLSG
jgi:hypothetical protein